MGFYLKSQSDTVKLISCLPKSNKGIKDDNLIISRLWHDGLPCPTQLGEPGGVSLDLGFLTLDLSYLSSALLCYVKKIFILLLLSFYTELQVSNCLVLLFNK